MLTKAFGVKFHILDKIKEVVYGAWEDYGNDDSPTCDRIRKTGLWNDHIAVQAGIAVYKMPDPETGLTVAQRERLEMLIEEAAEIVKAGTKILRHGYDNYNPVHKGPTNKFRLFIELEDLFCVYEAMMRAGDLPMIKFVGSAEVWKKKLEWTRHQGYANGLNND